MLETWVFTVSSPIESSGLAATAGYATAQGWTILVPSVGIWSGLGAAIVTGMAAGLYPALRAARLAPTDALRSA